MPVEVIMPKVDMDMTTGRIAAWHVDEGASVAKGDALFDIETDKAAMEVESPASGILRHVRAGVGEEVPIGRPVAWIYAEDEPAGDAPEPAAAVADGTAVPATPNDAGSATSGGVSRDAAGGGTIVCSGEPSSFRRATPAARRAARRHGLPLADIPGSGPRGRVQRADVQAVVEARAAAARSAGNPVEQGGLHIARQGAGTGVPILFLHGFAGDAGSWAALDPLLPPDRPRLLLDLPGHGRSPRRAARDFPELVEEVGTAFDALPAERLHLVGHSLGGAVAMALADSRPGRVASLTLLAPAGLGPAIAADILHGVVVASRPESLAPWLRQLVADESLITENYVHAAWSGRRDAALRAAQRALLAALFTDGTQCFDLRPSLARIRPPLRLIWGRDDRVIPWRHALAAPGHAALHLLPETGHLPQLERPDTVAMLIAASMVLAEAREVADRRPLPTESTSDPERGQA